MNDEVTFCRPSTWFFRRIGILIALTGGLGLFFLYDGMIGYPKKNFTVDLYEAFEAAGMQTPSRSCTISKSVSALISSRSASRLSGAIVETVSLQEFCRGSIARCGVLAQISHAAWWFLILFH